MILNISEFIANEFDVVGGAYFFAPPIDPTETLEFIASSSILNIESGRTQHQYDSINVWDYRAPYNTNVLADRELITTDDFFSHQTVPQDVSRYVEFNRQTLHHKSIVPIDGFPNPNRQGTLVSLAGKEVFDVYDVYQNKLPTDSKYLLQDYRRLKLDGRTKFTHAELISAGGDFDVIGGPVIVSDPPLIIGELYKLFGQVQQTGSVPSHPTNVMIVNRSAGALSTITVSPDPLGRFTKYYKDLPEGTTFMVIGLWDPSQTPYYEPVIIDRVIATKLD